MTTALSATERHATLIYNGWRTRVDGSWQHPHPEQRRRSFTFAEAWRCFVERDAQQPDPDRPTA